MTETLARLLLQLSEAGEPAILWGRLVKAYSEQELGRLLARGVLNEQTAVDEWDVCADCDCGLTVRPILRIGGSPIAACPVDQARDVRLDEADLRSFSISVAAIASEIAVASGLVNSPSQVMPGVWHFGTTPTRRSLFMAFARDSLLAPGLITALKAFERKRPITLIGPGMEAAGLLRFAEGDVHFVSTAEAFATAGPTFALDLDRLMPPASFEPRLTLLRRQSKLIFDGGELELPPISFKLLWLLAERAVSGDGIVSSRQIEKRLWATVVRKTAAADAVRNLRNSLKKLGGMRDPTALVKTLQNQGYVLDLTASEIHLVE